MEIIKQENFILMSEEELKETTGGIWLFLAGLAIGYVVGEVMQGIYQADKAGCFDAQN